MSCHLCHRHKIHEKAKQDEHLTEVVIIFINVDGKLKEYENKRT